MSARTTLGSLLLLTTLLAAPAVHGDMPHLVGGRGDPISVVVREAPLAEVFEMLSRNEGVNILLGKGVSGSVSVNLFEVSLDQAIRSIAEAAGYVAERRRGAYMVLAREEFGKDSVQQNTQIRAFKVEYSDPTTVADILGKYLSRYGEVTLLPQRRLLVVEDLPDFLVRAENLLLELDQEPRQILLEAKILEITLDDTETFGIDWARVLKVEEGTATFGMRGLSAGTPGLFFDLVTEDVQAALDALRQRGRVRTLSTPTLLALEHQEADVVIGDRLGFRVTTTINEVTTETVEFLESGVILRFKASVDRLGRIVLDVHPEVSTGVINDGLPEQRTTEVTTKLVSEDGQQIFIGGLIRDTASENRTGVPFLMDIPWLGWLFRRTESVKVSTETVVVITPHVVDGSRRRALQRAGDLGEQERTLREQRDAMDAPYGAIPAPIRPGAAAQEALRGGPAAAPEASPSAVEAPEPPAATAAVEEAPDTSVQSAPPRDGRALLRRLQRERERRRSAQDD